ncbi:tRNA-queuosine alpha-mannosyltransferase isoform X1 [Diabrotica undecimpunctata]|uniref:tRNA-queuosine alpha-mannosyltransferase isoform X1 n=1 Tax=Diabrotica undecimpunctata TaxID=50387 RepID=UPI003B632366
MNNTDVIIIEPFYGGSHKVLIDSITHSFQNENIKYSLVTLPSKKWHWRARCGALQLYEKIPKITNQKTLFASSVLNISELIGMRPDLSPLRKIIYFHENQLIYPVQEIKSRDVQYAYNQITTCLAADIVLFNSEFNMSSFLNNIHRILKCLPDHRPKSIKDKIALKSTVLYFPISFPMQSIKEKSMSVLHIVWPHRWEFDKGPNDFFEVLFKLKLEHIPFQVSVLGEMYSEVPKIFEKAKQELSDNIVQFGYVDSKESYYDVLSSAHVAVSTAKHEFFGVSMLEATYWGCFPLVPNSLVYPEIYPQQCLYKNNEELYKQLQKLCLNPSLSVKLRQDCDIDVEKYSDTRLIPTYLEIIKGS